VEAGSDTGEESDMSDIVESLRYWALPPAGQTREPENAALLTLAADEIERLRGLLREGVEYPGSTQWLQRVREALGE
jgi:hypothetical protein